MSDTPSLDAMPQSERNLLANLVLGLHERSARLGSEIGAAMLEHLETRTYYERVIRHLGLRIPTSDALSDNERAALKRHDYYVVADILIRATDASEDDDDDGFYEF